ncbi:hypothetical protein O9929_22960 [Vibrio lentus]|nr:hypothetical protein [Vibrio lentus]
MTLPTMVATAFLLITVMAYLCSNENFNGDVNFNFRCIRRYRYGSGNIDVSVTAVDDTSIWRRLAQSMKTVPFV